MRKFIITSIIFIITLLSACGTKENPIEILKPTEIEQKTSGSYEIETIDFNIGERNTCFTIKNISITVLQINISTSLLALSVYGNISNLSLECIPYF